MKKLYFIFLVLLLQATSLNAVKWYTADGTSIGPDGRKFWSTNLEYVSLPAGTSYCRIYQDDGDDTEQTRNFPDGALRFRIAKAMGYETPTGYGNTSVGGYSWNKSRDLYITREQALAVKSLDLAANGGTRLTTILGIQIFENLEELNVSGNSLSYGIIPLHVLYPKKSNGEYDFENPYHPWTGINHNQCIGSYLYTDPITGKKVNREYEYRYLGYMLRFFRHLKTLNASDCNITELYAGGFDSEHIDNIEYIDVSNNPYLYHLDINYSKVSDLDISGCTGLKTLLISHIKLSELDVTTNNSLETLYAPYNENLISIAHSGYYYNLENMDFRNCPLLTKIDHLENCPNIKILKCQNCNISSLDVHADAKLEMLLCSNNKLTTLDVSDNALKRLECANNLLTSLDCSGVSNVTLNYLDCSGNQLTILNVSHNDSLETLYCYSNNLTDLDLSVNTKLKKLRISNNSIDTLDITQNPLIEDFYCNNCGLNTILGFEDLTKLQICKANNNNLKGIDFTKLSALQTLLITNNKFTELDMSSCNNLKTLFCDAQGGYDDTGRWLKVLKLNSNYLTALRCDNNALLSLDLSNCPNLNYQGTIASTQRSIQDIKVYDRTKVCVELPNGAVGYDNGEDPLDYFHTWDGSGFDLGVSDILYRDGKYWLAIYNLDEGSAKADVDFYNKSISYCYYLWPNDPATINEHAEPTEALGKTVYNSGATTLAGETVYENLGRADDNITVKLYPYVMYINPLSKDVHSIREGESPFYSGTIYLDYDAIVPDGTTVYIAKKIKINKDEIYRTSSGGHEKVTADQLQLVQLVPGEGATEVVIPARTPVYVKSATENGLFSFDRNNHGGIVQPLGVAADSSDIIRDNIFRGVLKDSAITKYSVLALGRGKPVGSGEEGYTTESRIGFWPSSSTKIPAHRVFIPISELENGGSISQSSPGLLLSFIEDNNVTQINNKLIINNNQGWYTIDGRRLNTKPTEKGIYIHNGRKEVIK